MTYHHPTQGISETIIIVPPRSDRLYAAAASMKFSPTTSAIAFFWTTTATAFRHYLSSSSSSCRRTRYTTECSRAAASFAVERPFVVGNPSTYRRNIMASWMADGDGVSDKISGNDGTLEQKDTATSIASTTTGDDKTTQTQPPLPMETNHHHHHHHSHPKVHTVTVCMVPPPEKTMTMNTYGTSSRRCENNSEIRDTFDGHPTSICCIPFCNLIIEYLLQRKRRRIKMITTVTTMTIMILE